jgi:hypothetical protein
MKPVVVFLLVVMMALPASARAQVSPDVWRGFAEKIDVGSELNVRLQDGTRFRAMLVGVRDDAVLLQPKTRIAVPVQAIPYGAIASMERRKAGGVGAGKAAAIGVASGVGTFFAMMLIVVAALGD